MVKLFDKIFRFSFFSQNEISIKIIGLFSSNKLGEIINESSASIVDWNFVIILSTKRKGRSAFKYYFFIFLTSSQSSLKFFSIDVDPQ